ncbi:hypothetical protein SAMN05660649_04378 [Desulfotomaculum arcticum]|uniref:Uncharacterized protein n=1 Tax=Desulfotruncus arcticus DSM 17038 TaxID=1121424 RepID=A0A1I2YCC6_9FIRM|nr:hypothetical protein [Desulfotruncus arcticus]SFH23245.1 hypothetical protein SAMN05660649_04378 [Desulfotomaculum arcticum] [Desulfotruncus arcticus DSM 17038]
MMPEYLGDVKGGLLPLLTVHFIDGLTLTGEDWDEIINRLRDSSWKPEDSVEQYMKELARRTEIQTGVKIDWQDSEEFVKELKRAGIITQIIQH